LHNDRGNVKKGSSTAEKRGEREVEDKMQIPRESRREKKNRDKREWGWKDTTYNPHARGRMKTAEPALR